MARTSAAGRRTCFLIIVLLLLAAVLMGYQYLFPAPKGQTAHIFVDGKEAASFPLNKDLEYRVSGSRRRNKSFDHPRRTDLVSGGRLSR